MRKKQYIQPAAKEVKIHTRVALLVMSNVETQGLGDGENLIYDPDNEANAEEAW